MSRAISSSARSPFRLAAFIEGLLAEYFACSRINPAECGPQILLEVEWQDHLAGALLQCAAEHLLRLGMVLGENCFDAADPSGRFYVACVDVGADGLAIDERDDDMDVLGDVHQHTADGG